MANVGSSVGSSVGNYAAKTIANGGISGITSGGLGNAAASGLKGAINPYSLGGAAIGVASALMGDKSEYSGDYGNLTRGLDTAYDIASDAVNVIPGFGQAASLIMKGDALVGKAFNKWTGSGTDGMTATDAILGSSFTGSPLTALAGNPLAIASMINGWGGKKTHEMEFTD